MIQSFKEYGAKAAEVSCGRDHTLILTDDGEVLAFGSCDYGLLGTGNIVDAYIPTSLDILNDKFISKIVASRDHSLALSNDGEIFSWGRCSSGQLGKFVMLLNFLLYLRECPGHGDSALDMYSCEDYPRSIPNQYFDNKKIIEIAAMREKSVRTLFLGYFLPEM